MAIPWWEQMKNKTEHTLFVPTCVMTLYIQNTSILHNWRHSLIILKQNILLAYQITKKGTNNMQQNDENIRES